MTYESLQAYAILATRITLIIGAAWLISRTIKKRIHAQAKRYKKEALRLHLLARMASYAVSGIALLMISRELGIQTATVISLIGVIGISCGLAIKTSLANIFSGIFLMIEHPFEIGDTIVVDGKQGTIVKSNLYATLLKTDDSNIVRIPHDKMIKSSFVIEKE